MFTLKPTASTSTSTTPFVWTRLYVIKFVLSLFKNHILCRGILPFNIFFDFIVYGRFYLQVRELFSIYLRIDLLTEIVWLKAKLHFRLRDFLLFTALEKPFMKCLKCKSSFSESRGTERKKESERGRREEGT